MNGYAPEVEKGLRTTDATTEVQKDIVFSLEDGQVWASWYGREMPVHLGPETDVVPMMQDFLAQFELGRKLAAKNA
jgi:hypothetical protein